MSIISPDERGVDTLVDLCTGEMIDNTRPNRFFK